MSTRGQRLMRAVIVSTAVPVLVAACAPTGPVEPSVDDVRAAIGAAVETVPTVTGSLVNVASAGVQARSVRVALYVDDVTPTVLATTIDGALKAIWEATPFEPDHISISAVDGPLPDNATLGSMDGVDIVPIAEQLGLDANDVTFDTLAVNASTLRVRYGAHE